MNSLTVDYTEKFAAFWAKSFPERPCPPLPKQQDDLPLAAQMLLQNDEPILFQNLFAGKKGSGALPADTATRLQKNELMPQDADALRAAGYEHYALACESLAARLDDKRLANSEAEGRKRYLEQKKAREEWNALPLGHPAKAPSPEAVTNARRQWGLSGRPSWES